MRLGVFYEKGLGVAQSDVKALQWLRKAAEKDHLVAQMFLANKLAEGRGVTQSYLEAAKWFKKAADQGNDDAQCNLGIFLGKV